MAESGILKNIEIDEKNDYSIPVDEFLKEDKENKKTDKENKNEKLEGQEGLEQEENNKEDIDKKNIIEQIAEDAFGEMTDSLHSSDNVLDNAIGEMYDRWREEYLEEKENKQQEQEEKNDKIEENTNVEQQENEEQQEEGKFAEAQAEKAAVVEVEAGMEAGMSM